MQKLSILSLTFIIVAALFGYLPNSSGTGSSTDSAEKSPAAGSGPWQITSVTNQTVLSVGTPYFLHLAYSNCSFLTTGNVTYTAKFNSNQPFVIADVNKGNFDQARILNNHTVQFHGTPISKGDNKTGLATLLFPQGSDEKSRKATIDVNVKLDSLQSTSPTKVGLEVNPLFTNKTGTFVNSTCC